MRDFPLSMLSFPFVVAGALILGLTTPIVVMIGLQVALNMIDLFTIRLGEHEDEPEFTAWNWPTR